MFSKHDIQKLKELSIEEVAQKLNFSVSRHKTLCPFHEDSHPSLTFNVQKNRYRCFVCNAYGSTIDLVMKTQGWDFYYSCRWLAREFCVTTSDDGSTFEEKKLAQQSSLSTKNSSTVPIDLHYLEGLMAAPILSFEASRFLFDERKLLPNVVSKVGISSISTPTPMSGNPHGSWFNAPSLLIPYRDIDGRLISVQARYLGEKNSGSSSLSGFKEMPRFQFPKGGCCHVYNLPVLKTLEEGDELWITEGVTDCLAMLSSGRKAIAIPSATLLKPDDVALIRSALNTRHSSVHMSPDNDAPGARLFLELQKLIPSLHHHLLPSCFKDFGDYWKSLCAESDVKMLNVKC